jgi:integrase
MELPGEIAVGRRRCGRREDRSSAGLGVHDGHRGGWRADDRERFSVCCARCSARRSRTAVSPATRARDVKLPKRQHADRGYLTHSQVAALADAVERQPEVVRFLTYTGLRWGEMAALRVQDFEMLRGRVNVSRSVTESGGLVWSTPKTHERRSVPFPAALADELATLMVGKSRDALVFTDQHGGVLRNSNWRARVFQPAVEKCQKADESFPSITPHDLRHTAASLAVSAGANVKAVQRMLGHAKASMTLDVYAELFDEDLDGVADRLDTAIRSTADQLRTGRSQTRSSANT